MKIRREQFEIFAATLQRARRAQLAAQLVSGDDKATIDETTGNVVLENSRGAISTIELTDQGVAGLLTPQGRKFHFTRDGIGRISRIDAPASQTVGVNYTESGLIHEVHRNDRRLLACEYSEDNNILEATFADGARETLEYSAGQLIRTVDANGDENRFVRDNTHRVVAVVDPRGHSTRFDYNEDEGTPLRMIWPGGTEEAYEEEEDGSFSVRIDGRPYMTVVSDEVGDVERASFSDGHALSIKWDGDKPVEATNAHITVAFVYDDEGRLVKETQGDLEVTYEYDGDGNLITLNTSDGEAVHFRYDDDDLLVGLVEWSGKELTFQHDQAGSTVQIQFPNGVTTRATTSSEGLYSSIETYASGAGATAIVHELYHYDERDRLVQRETIGNTWRYSYDLAGRLLKYEGASGDIREVFEYDPAGNCIGNNSGRASYDERNRIVTAGQERFEHDVHGNLVTRVGGGGAYYRYNGQGHLVEATTVGGTKVEFAYDAFGRRILKRSGGTTTHYRWMGRQLLREWTEQSGKIVERRDYVFLPGGHYPVAVRINGNPYYYHTDRLGTPLALTDATGKIVWKAEYRAFGEARVLLEEVRQPLRFLGQYHDVETGLHYNVFRYYDPLFGRYLTPDPLRYGSGSTNFYTYAHNDPVNQRDPDGLIAPLVALAIIAGAAVIGGLIGGAIEAATAPPEKSGWEAFKEGFGWGALAGGVGAAVPIIGAAVGLGGAAIAAIGLGADAVMGGIEACSRDGASVGTFFKGAGIAVAATIATLGLSKIPGVKRALGAVGRRLSGTADMLMGRAKQAWYRLNPVRLAMDRNERFLTKQARKAIAARRRALTLEAANGVNAHSLKRHGPEVTDAELKRRVTTGIAPDNKLSPTSASTRFNSYNEWVQTQETARAKIAKRDGLDLSKPPPPGKERPLPVMVEHNRPIDDGFIGKPGTKQKVQATNPDGTPAMMANGKPKKPINVHTDTEPVSGLTRTRTSIEWDPSANGGKGDWVTTQHFPEAEGWDQAQGKYTIPP